MAATLTEPHAYAGPRGFVKLVAERERGRLLGAQVLATEGGKIIQTAALVLRQRMSIEELADQLFPISRWSRACAQTFAQDVQQRSCCAG